MRKNKRLRKREREKEGKAQRERENPSICKLIPAEPGQRQAHHLGLPYRFREPQGPGPLSFPLRHFSRKLDQKQRWNSTQGTVMWNVGILCNYLMNSTLKPAPPLPKSQLMKIYLCGHRREENKQRGSTHFAKSHSMHRFQIFFSNIVLAQRIMKYLSFPCSIGRYTIN